MKLSSMVPLRSEWTTSGSEEMVKLAEYSEEYKKVKALQHFSNIIEIRRVENKFLFGRYLLKKKLYKMKPEFKERTFLHATGFENVDSITKNNLDYRRVRRAKFGKGVSFSPHWWYANREGCRFTASRTRAMLVVKVLVGKSCRGRSYLSIPGQEYDTTTSDLMINTSHVFVKYSDDEFYPEYVAYYC